MDEINRQIPSSRLSLDTSREDTGLWLFSLKQFRLAVYGTTRRKPLLCDIQAKTEYNSETYKITTHYSKRTVLVQL